MSVGYSTIMYDADETATAVSDIGACRYGGIEFSLSEVREVDVDDLREECTEYGLDVYCVMSEWLESDAQVERVCNDVPLIAELGARRCGLLPPRRGLVDDAQVETWLTRVGEACAGAGITPLLHHHAATPVESPAEIEEWLERGPTDLQLLFDTAHYYPYGNVLDGIERFADDIGYVHYKDIDPAPGFERHVEALSAAEFNLDHVINYFRAFTDLGEGTIDFGAVHDRLRDAGYDGPITIEVENRHRKPLVHAKENYDYYASLAR